MTVSTYTNTQVNIEEPSEFNVSTTENEEACQQEIHLQPVTEYQASTLRSMTDVCWHTMRSLGSFLPNFNPPKPSVSEQLLTKNCILKMNTPQSLPTTKTHLSTPLQKQTSFQPSSQHLQNKAPSLLQSSRSFTWCPSQQAKQICKKESSLPLPRLHLTGRHSLVALSFKALVIPLFSKMIMRTFTQGNKAFIEKEHTSSTEHSSKPLSTKPPLSPMSLFSHIHERQTSTLVSQHKHLHKDPEQEQQQQQQQQEQQQPYKQRDEQLIKKIHAKQLTYTSIRNDDFPYGLPEEIIHFAQSEAKLSAVLHMRVTHYDILRICAEIMKLMLNSKELDIFEKRQTKQVFLEEAKKLTDSFSRQAQISRWIGVSTSVLGIIGAASPLFGEIAGDQILSFVQKHAGIWKGVQSQTFFESMGKIFTTLSQLSETASKIYELQESAHRTTAENYKELMRLGYDEAIRNIEETKDHWKSMDNLILQVLQTQHESARSLYN